MMDINKIFHVITIIAIGYLVYSLLSIGNSTAARFDRIEKSQQLIMQKSAALEKATNVLIHKSDSLDAAKMQQIEHIMVQVDGLRTQTEIIHNNVLKYRDMFDKNKINLPNPWKD